MSNAFVDNLRVESSIDIDGAYTHNGALTLETSDDALVDLFFIIAASRGKDITQQFARAYSANRDIATRILMWSRDVRGGAGERETFRKILSWGEMNLPAQVMISIIRKIPEIGRWDDGFVLTDSRYVKVFLDMYKEALLRGNGLAAKWAPREGSTNALWGDILRNHLGMTPRRYRKFIVGLSKTVEQNMCAREWSKIEYSHVPSVAHSRYKSAFAKRDQSRYAEYLNRVKSGNAKINASSVFPHDVLRSTGNAQATQAQWDALPSFIRLGVSFLPMVDVSGSMVTPISGSLNAIDVATALGLYLSERQKGAFKDVTLVFSQVPSIVKFKSTDILSKKEELMAQPWGMNTDLKKAFEKILDHAVQHKVPASDMPNFLIVLSDMEFDVASRGNTNFEHAKQAFENKGYRLPNVIFWNLNGRPGNVPVKYRKDGTALVSGYSPSLMSAVVDGDINPMSVMLRTVMVDRYKVV